MLPSEFVMHYQRPVYIEMSVTSVQYSSSRSSMLREAKCCIVVASHLQGPQINPQLACFPSVHLGFTQVPHFLPNSQKPPSSWTGYSKLPSDVKKVCKCGRAWCLVMDRHPTCTQHSCLTPSVCSIASRSIMIL